MDVPSFSDLGRNARDVFSKGYYHGKGLFKFNFKTATSKRFQMMSDTILNFEASKLNGMMETRYKANGGILLLKWTTEGILSLGYEFNKLIGKGVDLISEYTYNPETAAKSMKIGTKFTNDAINVRCEILNDMNMRTNLIGSFVVRCRDFCVGYRAAYDSALNKMTMNDLGVAYDYANLGFHFRSIPFEYGLSLWYKVMPDLDIATNSIYAKHGDAIKWTVGAGTKYKLDENATLRVKFNSDLQLATSFSQQLIDGITVILSFNVDCANATKGGHQAGLAFNVEA